MCFKTEEKILFNFKHKINHQKNNFKKSMETNPFIRENDEAFDVLMAEKFYILTNIHKKWKPKWDDRSEIKIIKVIFRGGKPWNRMDIRLSTGTQTVIGEFLEHYHPEDMPLFNANELFIKSEKFYGIEYEIDI
jgi:hypothetical protein